MVKPVTYVINANPGGNRKAFSTDSNFGNQNLNIGLTSLGSSNRVSNPFQKPVATNTGGISSKLGG